MWQKLLDLDRRWIYLFVGLSAVVPVLFPLGLKIGASSSVTALYDRVESLSPGDRVLISFDYGPSTGPENDPMADSLIRHCLARDLRVVVISLFPIGGVTEAVEEFNRATGGYDPDTLEFGDWPGKTYGVDAINLGYKDGAVAAMRQMNLSFTTVWPQDYELNEPIGSFEITRDVSGYSDFAFVCSIATGSIAEFWANIVNAQYNTPVAVGCTAVSVPRYFAYLKAGQMFALLGGLKGAAEYEKLVTDNYPRIKELTLQDAYYAAKGWDVQSLVYSIIIVFIILGNVAFLSTKKQGGTAA
jgi:hypothetical protein